MQWLTKQPIATAARKIIVCLGSGGVGLDCNRCFVTFLEACCGAATEGTALQVFNNLQSTSRARRVVFPHRVSAGAKVPLASLFALASLGSVAQLAVHHDSVINHGTNPFQKCQLIGIA
eukprot:6307979-Amphidinium_carterae.1